ncbi:MAG: Fe-S cluster assembly protein SufD [Hyphomicrobiaceae bacterium]|nr:MAG: Fe-S cluster assembly protein SufD [Hyphomicrobiaceae bacterium]
MTVAVTRTKAEQALSQNFEAVAAKLPGGEDVTQARKTAIGAFAALGLPHRRIEEWKYTDLRSALKEAFPAAVADDTGVTAAQIDAALEDLAGLDAHRMVFVNGVHRPQLSSVSGVKGLKVSPLGAALAETTDGLVRAAVPGQDAVIALNTAFMTDGALLQVADRTELAKPLLLVFARAGEAARLVTTRNIIRMGRGARATIIEAYVTLSGAVAGQTNALSEVVVGDRAHLMHTKVSLEGGAATHLASWIATLGADAGYRAFHLTAATGLARNHVAVAFKGEGAKLDISGAVLGRGGEHVDTTLFVDHAVPGCESRELFKSVLAERARGVFQGKVIVRPDAQKSDGKQMAQALMLSEEAEFDSKPELEIYADDVVCGHGSTAAEIDADLLFYLRARGIPLHDARAMLIESFIGEAIDKVEAEAVRGALSGIAKRRLVDLSA